MLESGQETLKVIQIDNNLTKMNLFVKAPSKLPIESLEIVLKSLIGIQNVAFNFYDLEASGTLEVSLESPSRDYIGDLIVKELSKSDEPIELSLRAKVSPNLISKGINGLGFLQQSGSLNIEQSEKSYINKLNTAKARIEKTAQVLLWRLARNVRGNLLSKDFWGGERIAA